MIKKQQGNNKQHPHTQKGLSVNIIRNQRQMTVEQIQDLHLYILVVNNDNIYIYKHSYFYHIYWTRRGWSDELYNN